MYSHFWVEKIVEKYASNNLLAEILKETEKATVLELQLFLAEVLKIAKHYGNPFYGDTGDGNNDRNIPEGTVDIREADHDLDEIYHFIHGGLHCFLVEIITRVANTPPKEESIPLLEAFFNYFINKRRGCTSCALRILELMPHEHQQVFLAGCASKRIASYKTQNSHSPACMELSLWLMTISPLNDADKNKAMKLIAAYSKNDTSYLSKYSHQRSVREFLKNHRLK